jgi:hypothetical protein
VEGRLKDGQLIELSVTPAERRADVVVVGNLPTGEPD